MPKQIHIEPKDEVLLGFLKGLPLFKSLNSEEIQMFFPVFNKYRYEAGEVIFKEGEVGDSAYIVLQGCLSLDRMGRKVKTFSKGEVFGIVVLLGIEPRTGTITAKEDSLLLELRAAEYFRDGFVGRRPRNQPASHL